MNYLILLTLYVLVTVINLKCFEIILAKFSKLMIQTKLQKPTFKVDFTTFLNITNIRDQK